MNRTVSVCDGEHGDRNDRRPSEYGGKHGDVNYVCDREHGQKERTDRIWFGKIPAYLVDCCDDAVHDRKLFALALDYVRDIRLEGVKEIVNAEGYPFALAREMAKKVCEDFAAGRIDRFGIVCTEYVSLISQEARVKWVLPLEAGEGKASVGAVFEPDEVTVLNALIPEYVAGLIMCAVKESFACEVAARRVAMDSAGKNAREMIANLGLEYNRARQGAITQEITEIVAGSGM